MSLLIGDEGIGKSLFWVWVVAAVTTGGGRVLFPEFGIPKRDPRAWSCLGAITEDDWQTRGASTPGGSGGRPGHDPGGLHRG